MEINEFKFWGQSAEKITVVIGLFLVLYGIFVSIISDSQSFTSLIPSIFGLPLLLSGFAALLFSNKKSLFMHIAVVFGLVTFLAGLDFFRSMTHDGFLIQSFWADISKLMLLVTGGLHTYICVQSFRFIRKQRTANNA
ncbi:hypothetical protein N9301_09980 [Paracoccaceae bacterium]|nr:hypothetical protein [Paracoccaceae bacterium]